jgi:lipoprotein-releasing system ATP-binding protein
VSPPLLIARNVCKRFVEGEREIEVLRQLDLQVDAGERIAIIGASGVGKSTLLHILGVLERPTDGQVLYEGRDLLGLSGQELARFRNEQIGFVFQFHYLLAEFTALENVMMPALIRHENYRRAEERAALLLKEVGLESRSGHRPGKLSGGEQQRVAVARAIIQQPRLMLADEPTGNLDPGTAMEIQGLLLELCANHQSTLITVTHNLKFAQTMDRCLELRDGKLAPVEVKNL